MSNQTGVKETWLIDQLFTAQNSLCFCCDEPMIRGESALRYGRMGWSREHVYPRSGTGKGMLNNQVLSHPKCNGDRGGREPTEAEVEKAKAIYALIGLVPFVYSATIKRKGRKVATAPLGTRDWPPRLGSLLARP